MAAADAAVEPWALLKAVRDPDGRVIDFVYCEINRIAALQQRLSRDDLLGRSVAESLPEAVRAGIINSYIRCMDTGEPLILDDLSYSDRRYDMRGVRVGTEYLSLNWRDVNEKFVATELLVDSENRYRSLAGQLEEARRLSAASADSMIDPQMLLEAARDRDGRVIDFVYRSVNRAACSYRRLDEQDMLGKSALDIQPGLARSGLFGRYADCVDTGESVVLDDFKFLNAVHDDDRRYDIRAVRAGVDLMSLTYSDVTDRFQAAARIAASEQRYRLLAENSSDMVIHIRDGRFAWVSPSVAAVVGGSPEYWIGRPLLEIIPPEDAAAYAARMATLAAGGTIQDRIRVVAIDGVTHWVDLHEGAMFGDDGQRDGFTGALRLVDAEVAAEHAVAVAQLAQDRANTLFRRSVDSATVGMCLVSPKGDLIDVNEALCEFFGYDAEKMKNKTLQEVTAEAYVEADLDNLADLLAGRIESYRLTKQYIHADGHPIWGNLSVGCLRGEGGRVEVFIAQINDVTAQILAGEQLAISEKSNRALAEDLQSELASAAKYVQAILPADLAGTVSAASRYVPSSTLGGDFFDFLWIEDDHLIVYLLDVSGHGVESALIAVSVHNLLRSGSFSTEVMLEPNQVLAALNNQFAMDQNNDNYFTIFYGVYQRSSRTLRYANAGHPPGLLFKDGQSTALPSEAVPVGMFDDIEFPMTTVSVPLGSQLLLYSDGAYEFPVATGGLWSHEEFVALCSRLTGSPDWTLNDLMDDLRRHSAAPEFGDDCTLLRLTFG